MSAESDSIECQSAPAAGDGPRYLCPDCGGDELVKAQVDSHLYFVRSDGARCLTCGHRFRVPKEVHAALRRPVLGEPHETLLDKRTYMGHTPMRRVHAMICVCGFVVGMTIGALVGVRFDVPYLTVVIMLAITFGAWWFGRWLQPPVERIPGKCPKCRYDLRGTTADRCPECGRKIDDVTRGELAARTCSDE